MSDATYEAAFKQGQEAVRMKPVYAPRNPYNDEEDEDKFYGWEDGAADAGLYDIYTNGILKEK